MQGRTKTLAVELGRFGIIANAIGSGFIATEMTATAARRGVSFADYQATRAAEIPVRRAGQPEDIANATAFLASEEALFVSGQVSYVAGGKLRVCAASPSRTVLRTTGCPRWVPTEHPVGGACRPETSGWWITTSGHVAGGSLAAGSSPAHQPLGRASHR